MKYEWRRLPTVFNGKQCEETGRALSTHKHPEGKDSFMPGPKNKIDEAKARREIWNRIDEIREQKELDSQIKDWYGV